GGRMPIVSVAPIPFQCEEARVGSSTPTKPSDQGQKGPRKGRAAIARHAYPHPRIFALIQADHESPTGNTS
ncbi:hypothetical protein HAX54_046251, partial [Datura stramonium]|nr:hypothetical protein [Datura stramonium]